jgi:hypothetical protein
MDYKINLGDGTMLNTKITNDTLLKPDSIETQRKNYLFNNKVLMTNEENNRYAKLISFAIQFLQSHDLSQDEILNLVNLRYSSQDNIRKISILIISSNNKILNALEKQFSYFNKTSFYSFILSSSTINTIKNNSNQDELLNYDLLILTSIDYLELENILVNHKNKIIEVTVSPCHQTLIELSRLPLNSRFSIIYHTTPFLNLILNILQQMNFNDTNIFYYHDTEYNPRHHDDNNINVVIDFDNSPTTTNPSFNERNIEFLKMNGQMIHFEYNIDQISLIQLEKRIQFLI